MKSKIIAKSPNHEIVSSRIFKVTIEKAYEAWGNPEHLKNWWGPKGFTNTFHEFDFRRGGQWRFTMHGPDKGNYENFCEFVEIESPVLISWKRYSKPLFQVIATFESVSDQATKIVFRMIFDTVEECDKIKRFAVEKNEENFDKLQNVLQDMN